MWATENHKKQQKKKTSFSPKEDVDDRRDVGKSPFTSAEHSVASASRIDCCCNRRLHLQPADGDARRAGAGGRTSRVAGEARGTRQRCCQRHCQIDTSQWSGDEAWPRS